MPAPSSRGALFRAGRYVGYSTLTLDKMFIYVNGSVRRHSGCAVRAVPVLGFPTHTQGSGPLGCTEKR
jgi:hypothetical protein